MGAFLYVVLQVDLHQGDILAQALVRGSAQVAVFVARLDLLELEAQVRSVAMSWALLAVFVRAVMDGLALRKA